MSLHRVHAGVHTALDTNQPAKALKLLQGYTDLQSLALKAQAYAKSGQRADALATLLLLLSEPEFQELHRAASWANVQSKTPKVASTKPKKPVVAKKGKKGKKPPPKKPTTTAIVPASPPPASFDSPLDTPSTPLPLQLPTNPHFGTCETDRRHFCHTLVVTLQTLGLMQTALQVELSSTESSLSLPTALGAWLFDETALDTIPFLDEESKSMNACLAHWKRDADAVARAKEAWKYQLQQNVENSQNPLLQLTECWEWTLARVLEQGEGLDEWLEKTDSQESKVPSRHRWLQACLHSPTRKESALLELLTEYEPDNFAFYKQYYQVAGLEACQTVMSKASLELRAPRLMQVELALDNKVPAILQYLQDVQKPVAQGDVLPYCNELTEAQAQELATGLSVDRHCQLLDRLAKLFPSIPLPSVEILVQHGSMDSLLLAAKQVSPLQAAAMLEQGLEKDPHHARCKIQLLQLYGRLQAIPRALEIYQSLSLKHIQHETCSHLIFPLLHSFGFYDEVITTCQKVLRLHVAMAKETSDHAWKALCNGALTQADEFLMFYKNKLVDSLVICYAKGLVLDCAVVYGSDPPIGAAHGICGDVTDTERAQLMMEEVFTPTAALNILQIKNRRFTDNRDKDLVSGMVSAEELKNDTLRRAHFHRILLRAVQVSVKSPKKGKVVSATEDHLEACRSLLEECQAKDGSHETEQFVLMRCLCQCLAVFGGLVEGDDDTMTSREEQLVSLLGSATSQVSKIVVDQPCLFVTDCLVPVFALTRMLGQAADIFGWGPRKKTKAVAQKMEALSVGLQELVSKCRHQLDLMLALPDQSPDTDAEVKVIERIRVGHEATRESVEPILNFVQTTLSSFVSETE